jgi:ParB family chromosome partitioning protein
MNTKTATAYEVGHLYEVAPGELKIGTNVRTDTRPDAKEFAASIRARGVLEVISAYVDAEGSLTVLRGQRRTVVAVKVGTPTVPVRVVPSPDDVDRIIDQVSENLHRQDMHPRETRDAIEQLAMIGVSAAQIAKRAALPRSTVDSALTVAANPTTKERMDAAGMTLEDAATFAEFEDDPDAIATLTQAWESPYQRPRIAHIVQRLRNERAETQALQAEVDRLRTEGKPVLDPQDAPHDLHRHRIANLRDADGQHVPEEQWPAVTGAAVVVTVEWSERDDDAADDVEPSEPEQVYVPVWICTDPQAAGLHYGTTAPRSDAPTGDETHEEMAAREAETEARREAESAQRRQVIANNKAWKAAEVVRREWLTAFLTRRSVPAGAESLIARAVIGSEYSLSYALQHGHTLLPSLLGIKPVEDTTPAYYGNRATCARIVEQATTPRSATMRTLAAVIAAWEGRSGTHTWRNPNTWDAAVMGSLVGWGYPASEVEQLLIPGDDAATEPN